jgi:hypothetical protein
MRYLLVKFFRQPGGQINEQVGFVKRLRKSDEQDNNIILDYKEKKLVKCFIENKRIDSDFTQLNSYYKQIYPDLISELEKMQE